MASSINSPTNDSGFLSISRSQSLTTSTPYRLAPPAPKPSNMMSTPIPHPGYVDSGDYRTIDDKFRNSNAVVVSGRSGSGKSCASQQVVSKYVAEKRKVQQSADQLMMYKLLDCSSLNTLVNDLAPFCRQHHFELPSMFIENPTWEIILELFQELNKPNFAHMIKLFILDDVEQLNNKKGVLGYVNEICRRLSSNGEQDHCDKWKIILTTQKKVQDGQTKYPNVGDNFVFMDGFTEEETRALFKDQPNVTPDLIERFMEQLGTSPLALSIAVGHLDSNQFEDTAKFCAEYLDRIKSESANVGRDKEAKDRSALVAIRVSIERMLCNDLGQDRQPWYKKLIQILACLNQKNISKELLISCAETVVGPDDPKLATMSAERLINQLMTRHLCTKEKGQENMHLFSLHALVKESMELILEPGRGKVEILRIALESLNRLMPKDGRHHKTGYIGFYRQHAEKLCEIVDDIGSSLINRIDTPLILLLQIDLLAGIGYCLRAQRKDDNAGDKKLIQARDKYCKLVTGKSYKSFSVKRVSQTQDRSLVSNAEKLYKEGQNMDMGDHYADFIERLPRLFRLTEKDIQNMLNEDEDASDIQLENDHMKRRRFESLAEDNKVITDGGVLGKVYLGEVLGRIYHVWCKHHSSQDSESMLLGEAGAAVYRKVFEDHKIYLLSSLMIERDCTTIKLKMPELGQGEGDNLEQKERKLRDIQNKLKELKDIGKMEGKEYAFEAGLMRSNLSTDHYNEMLCTEELIQCQGRLYGLTKKDEDRREGENMLTKVEDLANSQVRPHSALSYSYKKFAMFLFNCEQFGDSVKTIIKAMKELHKYMKADSNDDKVKHPEYKHRRFRDLYKDLTKFYERYRNQAGREKLLEPNTPESKYLIDVVKHSYEAVNGGGNQTTDTAAGEFEQLETIAQEQGLIGDDVDDDEKTTEVGYSQAVAPESD